MTNDDVDETGPMSIFFCDELGNGNVVSTPISSLALDKDTFSLEIDSLGHSVFRWCHTLLFEGTHVFLLRSNCDQRDWNVVSLY